MKYALVWTPYLSAVALFAAGIMELFWPFLIASCVVAAWWNMRDAALLALAVIVVQWAKAEFGAPHVWVYWSAIYVALGVLSLVLSYRVIGITAVLVGLSFLLPYVGIEALIAHSITELIFMAGLCVAVCRGSDGGISAFVRGPSAADADRRASFVSVRRDSDGHRDMGVVARDPLDGQEPLGIGAKDIG